MSEYTSEINRVKTQASSTQSQIAKNSRILADIRKDPITYINRLPSLLAQQRYSELLQICVHLLSIDPDNHIVLRNQGHALFMLGNYQQALESYQAICQKIPDTQSFSMQGKILNYLGRHQEALHCYQEALILDPNNVNALIGLGDLFLEKNAEQALHSYKKAYEIEPKNFFNLTQMGIALSRLGRQEEALVRVRTAYSLNQRYITNLFALGSLLMDLNRPKEASSYYLEAFRLFPDSVEAAYGAGVAFHKLALDSKSKDEKLKPSYNCDQYSALEYYEKALEIDPEFALAIDSRSSLLGQMDKPSVIAEKLKYPKETKQKSINFSGLPLTKTDVYPLSELLIAHCGTLKNLSLANTQLTDETFAILIERLKYYSLNLTHLNLNQNFLTDDSVTLVAERLVSDRDSLQILKLSHNQVSGKGLTILGSANK